MTIVAFKKEISLKSLSLFSKTIVRQYCSFKLEKKTFNTYKRKEKVQKNSGSRRHSDKMSARALTRSRHFRGRLRAETGFNRNHSGTGSRGAKCEQNVKFSLRKITDIICCEFALLVLPIFLPQVILLWALRITEIDLHRYFVPRSESEAFRKKAVALRATYLGDRGRMVCG